MPALVSIVVPTFNRADLIRATLASASAQSYASIEIIVVDDASSDETEAVVARASSLDSRIRLIRNPTNRGCGGARNRGADDARGEFVCFLDSDDLWHPEKVRMQVERLIESPGVAYVACQTQHFRHHPGDDPYLWNTFTGSDLLLRFSSIDLPFSIGATLWRKEAFDSVGRFFECQPTSEDLDFFLRACASGVRSVLLPVVLQHYRNHPAGHQSIGAAAGRVQATCLALRSGLECLRAKGRTEERAYEELLISVVQHAHRYLEIPQEDAANKALALAASFAYGTKYEKPFAFLNNGSNRGPAECFEELSQNGLVWNARKKWWRVHLVVNEPLRDPDAGRRYSRA